MNCLTPFANRSIIALSSSTMCWVKKFFRTSLLVATSLCLWRKRAWARRTSRILEQHGCKMQKSPPSQPPRQTVCWSSSPLFVPSVMIRIRPSSSLATIQLINANHVLVAKHTRKTANGQRRSSLDPLWRCVERECWSISAEYYTIGRRNVRGLTLYMCS